jgi:hypothetical protein
LQQYFATYHAAMSNAAAQPQPPNRLTIGFLMLWTLGTALILACHRAVDDSPPPNALALATAFYLLTFAFVNGLAIAGALLFMQRKAAKVGGLPTQPGHWLLLIRGFATISWLSGWVTRAAIEWLWNLEWQFSPSLFLAMQFLPATALSFGGYTIALRRNTEVGRVWRLALRLMQINAALGAVITIIVLLTEPLHGQMLPYTLTSCLNPFIFAALLIALTTDRQLNSRDFLHWAGAVAALINTMLPFIYQIAVALIRS